MKDETKPNYEFKVNKLLEPMLKILDTKNIYRGIHTVLAGDELYCIFEQAYLSEPNCVILRKISYVYSNVFFFSDNLDEPSRDRLVYWAPAGYCDESSLIEEIKKKKAVVLKLNISDYIAVMGTTIMLANALQEQDPLALPSENNVYSADELKRHDHYEEQQPDTKWMTIAIFLDKENPLRDNPYAPFASICDINSTVACDNVIGTIFAGYKEKTMIVFDCNRSELEEAIIEYYMPSDSSSKIPEDSKKLLLERIIKSQDSN